MSVPSPAASSPTPPDRSSDYQLLALPLALFVGSLLLLAFPVLSWWYWEYTKPESYYGYAFFVPPIVGVMLWHKRGTLAASAPKPCSPALLATLPALFLLVVAIKTEMQAVMSAAFLFALTGGTWFVMGTRWLKTAAFPLLFLWLLAPLPGPVLNDLTLSAQQLSTTGAVLIFRLLALHPLQDGSLIRLENYTLNVDVPCSGFKLLLSLLMFSAAFAYLTDTTPGRRWGLFLLSLPLSLLVNSIRIALIGLVGDAMGSSAADRFHDWSGLFCLVLCMTLLFGIAKAAGCRTFAGQPLF